MNQVFIYGWFRYLFAHIEWDVIWCRKIENIKFKKLSSYIIKNAPRHIYQLTYVYYLINIKIISVI